MKSRLIIALGTVISYVAVLLCTGLLIESLWRVYGLRMVASYIETYRPASVEQVSAQAAPLLAQSTGAEPLYRIVQSQHAELQEKHEFLAELVDAHYQSWILVAGLSGALLILLLFIPYVQRPSTIGPPPVGPSARDERAL